MSTTTSDPHAHAPAPRYAALHAQESVNGPGDARPTALDIVRDDSLVDALSGKVMLITGCSSGIGVETARALHATGADIYITVRDVAQGRKVADDILAHGGDGAEGKGQGRVEVLPIELDSFESVRKAAKEFREKEKRLDVLVCNAGVMACPYSETKDGHERQFGTNHLGHFLLFQLLKPLLLSCATTTSPSRVICLSSSGHHGGGINFSDLSLRSLPDGYSPWQAYGQSKTANIYMANEITRRYGNSTSNLYACSVMPGGIETPLQKYQPHIIPAAKKNPDAVKGMKSTAQGAATTVLAAVGTEWKSVGAVYMEDCAAAEPGKKGTFKGYVEHAFDDEAERRLWGVSCEFVGVADD